MSALKDRIASGSLARLGLLDGARIDQCAEVAAQAEAANLETIRVLFTDQHGILRGKTVVASALPSLFADGMAAPSTLLLKDTSHRTVFPVWEAQGAVASDMRGAGDILMVPDPATFRVLPWSPHSAWLLCDLADCTGASTPLCTRGILRKSVDRLATQGMALVVGLEVEFHVFRVLDPKLGHAAATMPGQPVQTENLAQGYQFLTETQYDALEPVMDDLRRTCEGLGLPIRSMEVEMGPSQFEFTFDPAAPMTHADNMVMLRTAVKQVCARHGLHATFMCKPNLPNAVASGWHLHQSLTDMHTGSNLFQTQEDALTPECSGWIAGLLAHAAQTCLLSTPTVNGYKRYQPHQLAPNRIVWARDNRGAMIRVLTKPGDPASRIENRIAEPAANPYLFFASQIIAGMDGLTQQMVAPAPVENPYDAEAAPLPDSLLAAITAFDTSPLYRATLGDAFVDYLCKIRRAEWDRYHLTVSAWEQQEYFGLY
ncbi:glutamine synthetase [Sulfitobacter sp. M57]|uniref:glutamine synthetase family protein n=1 Tax=unclassified Sulfitobacter TaxID=196795 RepID=UPI0023E1A58A|nr:MULTISPECIES: glutamine synthetase family protein [unclassified Sulfitobacter]MDF3415502.1 glutamine synthetase [Sulfitobacter sp. KE5]MDF3422983.1 glutamine synthetase [Sulfitobacter sp. KE43]MDF3434048.1 glutamine synthetase [Sulfitobacter sp. KE42]MDF3459919.1 glutamine synthetase [Sulfitobacter sp. S74]MDF3463587.1 glutamine synthetase [Sulfitobacter sp. Ks18]